MTARDDYAKVFGAIKRLDEGLPWTNVMASMFEWLAWDTKSLLGIDKTSLVKHVVQLCSESACRSFPAAERLDYVKSRLAEAPNELDWKVHGSEGVTSVREGLRRAKYHSEDYLNKEFDLFWSLASSCYLDRFYQQFKSFGVKGGGTWRCYGNGGMFKRSVGMRGMQMDNLSYNARENVLVANELKWNAHKNVDQLLKYAMLFDELKKGEFIPNNTRFALLFICRDSMELQWDAEIENEVTATRKKSGTGKDDLGRFSALAKTVSYESCTWNSLSAFSVEYLGALDPKRDETERKLIVGFNKSLDERSNGPVQNLKA